MHGAYISIGYPPTSGIGDPFQLRSFTMKAVNNVVNATGNILNTVGNGIEVSSELPYWVHC